jgi:DNA-binding transcriptional LysR family regulator
VELRHLTCFVAVAEELSFSRAADRLLYATSNVSQHVRHLERELEVPLFDRSGRQIRLTPAGDRLLVEAKRILADADHLRVIAKEASQGHVGTVPACYCPGASDLVAILMHGTAEEHPDVRIAFEVRQTADVLTSVLHGESLIGISRMDAPDLRSLELTAHPRSFVVLPNDHPLSIKPILDVGDFAHEDMILIDRRTNQFFHDETIEFFHAIGVTPRYRLFPLKTVEHMMDLVATGQGITMVTEFETKRYPRRGTVVRPLRPPHLMTRHNLLWRSDQGSPVVAVVVALAERLLPTFAQL